MKKTGLIVLICLLAVTFSFGQKTKQERLGQYTYTQLPLSPFPQEYENYFIEVNTMWGNKYARDIITNGINIAGYTKKDNEGDFRVFVDEYNFSSTSPEQGKEIKTKKVDGVEKKETYYYYTFESQYKIKVSIFDKAGEKVFTKDYDLGKSFKTGSHMSSNEAYKEYQNMRSKAPNAALAEGTGSANSDINHEYGFPSQQFSVEIYNVKPKKFDYSDFTQALGLITEGFAIVSKDENDVDEAKEKIQQAIAIWQKALEEADIENKKARVDKDVAYAAQLNIGVAYILMKDYESALNSFDKCKEIKKSGGGISYMITIAKKRLDRATANNLI